MISDNSTDKSIFVYVRVCVRVFCMKTILPLFSTERPPGSMFQFALQSIDNYTCVGNWVLGCNNVVFCVHWLSTCFLFPMQSCFCCEIWDCEIKLLSSGAFYSSAPTLLYLLNLFLNFFCPSQGQPKLQKLKFKTSDHFLASQPANFSASQGCLSRPHQLPLFFFIYLFFLKNHL